MLGKPESITAASDQEMASGLYFRPTLEETLHSLRNRIGQQRETITALQARADKAEADLRTAREGFARYQAGASDRHIRDIGKITNLQTEVERLRGALVGVKKDRAYQKLTGGQHFTSAPTEQEWKAESAKRAWAAVDAALALSEPGNRT